MSASSWGSCELWTSRSRATMASSTTASFTRHDRRSANRYAARSTKPSDCGWQHSMCSGRRATRQRNTLSRGRAFAASLGGMAGVHRSTLRSSLITKSRCGMRRAIVVCLRSGAAVDIEDRARRQGRLPEMARRRTPSFDAEVRKSPQAREHDPVTTCVLGFHQAGEAIPVPLITADQDTGRLEAQRDIRCP